MTHKVHQAFATLRPVWRSKNLSYRTKRRLFNSNAKPVLLNGAETWRYTKKSDHHLSPSDSIHQILYDQSEFLSKNCDEKTGQEPITDSIQSRKWRWIGHIMRQEQTSITRNPIRSIVRSSTRDSLSDAKNRQY